MTNPRWTVDGEYRTEAGDLLAWVCSTNPFDPEPAAALVAAVRDADTLRQAREILAEIVGDDDCWYDHHGYCQAHGWLQEGTCPHKRARDLLFLPVSPDTPTPTGQT